jgi:hypothetical protein
MGVLRPVLMGTVILAVSWVLGGPGIAAQSEGSTLPWEVCEPATRPFDPDDIRLTGVWRSGDGGIYYIRQVGERIVWQGQSDAGAPSDQEPGRTWSNVAQGTVDATGLITLDWADVPRGNILGSGNLTVQAEPAEDGNVRLRIVDQAGHFTDMSALRGWHARGESRDRLLEPCAAVTRSTTSFRPAFSFRDEAGVGLTFFDLGRVVELSAGDHTGVESGITVWSISPGAARTCDSRTRVELEAGADAFLAWLQSRDDLLVSEPVDVTVDGRPATMVDLTPAPDANACLGNFERVRLWQVTGADASVDTSSMARVIVMDVEDATLAIEIYGDEQETWLPLAQRVVDSIDFLE